MEKIIQVFSRFAIVVFWAHVHECNANHHGQIPRKEKCCRIGGCQGPCRRCALVRREHIQHETGILPPAKSPATLKNKQISEQRGFALPGTSPEQKIGVHRWSPVATTDGSMGGM